jgi:hypothetical protein
MIGKNETLFFPLCLHELILIFFLIGVFLLVVGGAVLGFFILVIEIVFKRQKERIEREKAIARTAMIYWRRRAEVRIIHSFYYYFLIYFLLLLET